MTPADPPACAAAVTAVDRGGLARLRPGVLVHERDPASAGARSGRRDPADDRSTPGHPQSRGRDRDSRAVPFGSSRRAHPLPSGAASRCSACRWGSVGDPWPVRRAAESLGARLVFAPMAAGDGSPRHDPSALAAACRRCWRERARRRSGTHPADDRTGTDGLEPASRGDDTMAMTAAVKDELSRVDIAQTVLPPGRDGGASAVRRRPAHRVRPGGGRGRARHGRGGPPTAPGDRRGLRLPQRDPRTRLRRAAQEQPLHRPHRQGRRGARPPDRPARRPRPAGARPAAASSSRPTCAAWWRPGGGRSWRTVR